MNIQSLWLCADRHDAVFLRGESRRAASGDGHSCGVLPRSARRCGWDNAPHDRVLQLATGSPPPRLLQLCTCCAPRPPRHSPRLRSRPAPDQVAGAVSINTGRHVRRLPRNFHWNACAPSGGTRPTSSDHDSTALAPTSIVHSPWPPATRRR
jgi:hypothetical protein